MFKKILKAETPTPFAEDDDPFLEGHESRCQFCAYRNWENPAACTAFPEGIPVGILVGLIDHTNPVEGDGGLRYAPAGDDGEVVQSIAAESSDESLDKRPDQA